MASSTFVESNDAYAQHTTSGLSLTDVLLFCMALIWGFNFIVVKFATGIFAPLAFTGARMFLALVVLWGIFLARRLPLPNRRDILILLALGALGNGLYQILWVEGMARTRASDAALLVSAAPAFIAALGWLRGEERAGIRGLSGIALSLAGIGLVVAGAADAAAGKSTLAGNAFILGSVICWAVYSVYLRPVTTRIDGLTLSAVTMTGGIIPVLITGAPSLAATNWHTVPTAGWAALAYSGVFALVVAYLFWYRGVRVLGPTRASMYSNLQPIVAMFAAWSLLGEIPRAMQLMGASCIIGGLMLTRIGAPSREPARS